MSKILSKKYTYIDLFAGIGGFRLAMDEYSDHNAVCLYASEIDEAAQKTYELNFNQKPLGDIRKINPIEMGYDAPDVVCGGFPCQTFSKGGYQAGFKDSRGTLFREIIRIIESYQENNRPKILILENVQNLISHDNGETWKTIHHEISEAGYNVVPKPIVLAPKDVGIPQLRNRAIILAVRKDIYSKPIDLSFDRVKQNTLSIKSIIDDTITPNQKKQYKISKEQFDILNCWDEFIHIIPKDKRIIGFPIWTDEFGRRCNISHFPVWKQYIINKNRDLYKTYKLEIDEWMKKWKIRKSMTATNRKFEWQAGKDINSVFDGIIQFRTSGVRVKRPTESPALVAMDHRPIYGPEKRFFTPSEALKLQSFPADYKFDEKEKEIFKQLGNAVNAKVIKVAFESFINYLEKRVRE